MPLTLEPLHGRVGTPAACAISEDPILSPNAAMGAAGGPRNTIPLAINASGSSGFYDAWPQPGQTVETPVISAICINKKGYSQVIYL